MVQHQGIHFSVGCLNFGVILCWDLNSVGYITGCSSMFSNAAGFKVSQSLSVEILPVQCYYLRPSCSCWRQELYIHVVQNCWGSKCQCSRSLVAHYDNEEPCQNWIRCPCISGSACWYLWGYHFMVLLVLVESGSIVELIAWHLGCDALSQVPGKVMECVRGHSRVSNSTKSASLH